MGATLGVTLGVTNSKDNRPDSQQVKCWVCWVSLTVCRYVGAQWRLSNMSHNRTMRHARQSIWSGQIYNWSGQIYKTSGHIYKMWTNRKNLLPPAVRALAVRRIMSTFATKSGEARQRLSRSASRRVTLATERTQESKQASLRSCILLVASEHSSSAACTSFTGKLLTKSYRLCSTTEACKTFCSSRSIGAWRRCRSCRARRN